MESTTHPVTVIGAGPYGLAVTAHLRSAGVGTYNFGRAMEFWQCQMPRGMLLRSSWDASHISDPRNALTLNEYEKAHKKSLSKPVPLEEFIAYGSWVQRQTVPELDPRRVNQVKRDGKRFKLQTEDGEEITAQHVIIAAGIAPFAYRPAEFQNLPQSLASHSSDHQDLSRFSGRRVLVVGGGQSAIETAVLLTENGAEVDVFIRAVQLRWLKRRSWVITHAPKFVGELFYHRTDVGPPGLNQLSARPELFRRFPRQMQDRIAYRCIRPAASGWLMPRAGKLKISVGRRVISAQTSGDGVQVKLDDGTQRTFDHVILATGFKVDISRYGFLSPQLVQSVQSTNGYPILSPGLESSVPGLYFVGAPAAWSFGPLMRFVSGTGYTGQAVARSIAGKLGRTKNGNGVSYRG